MKPNVLFVLTDDQRFDTIEALNNPAISTPNMNRLVSAGTAFTQAHIPSGTCGAVCCPSRAMLHSGRSLFTIHNIGGVIPEDHTTMGEVFKREGYTTFGTGKWHNGTASFNRSFMEGEHIFFGGMEDHWNVPCFHYDPTGEYAATIPRCVDIFTTNEVEQVPGEYMENGHHSSDLLAEATATWIRQYEKDNPFFAHLSFLAPHDPRTMPERYRKMYPPESIELPPNFLEAHPFDNGALDTRDELLETIPRSPDAVRRHIAEYYAMITHLDDCLGRVFCALEEKGLLDNTLIVFTGDNGLALGQHGLMGKQNHYDHSVRVPLILSGPGVEKGIVTDSPVYLFDILATLCEHLGFEIPESSNGLSFAHELKGERRPTRERLYFGYIDLMRSVKKGKYKLTETCVDKKHAMTQLYDLSVDPWERENRADDPGFADIVAELRRDLRELADEWSDSTHVYGRRFWDAYDGVCGNTAR